MLKYSDVNEASLNNVVDNKIKEEALSALEVWVFPVKCLKK
jgi:Holliday junction DNA helicase RuvA